MRYFNFTARTLCRFRQDPDRPYGPCLVLQGSPFPIQHPMSAPLGPQCPSDARVGPGSSSSQTHPVWPRSPPQPWTQPDLSPSLQPHLTRVPLLPPSASRLMSWPSLGLSSSPGKCSMPRAVAVPQPWPQAPGEPPPLLVPQSQEATSPQCAWGGLTNSRKEQCKTISNCLQEEQQQQLE